MSETKNTKPGEKGVRDLTPSKDAKGGGKHGRHQHNVGGHHGGGTGRHGAPQPDDIHTNQP